MNYEQISSRIVTAAHESNLYMKDAMRLCSESSDEEVLDAIRFLVDEGVLSIDKMGYIKPKK